MAHDDYLARIDRMLASLQLPAGAVAARGLPLQTEATELAVAEIGDDGLEHLLIPPAADAWRAMRAAARAGGIDLRIVSAYRDLERQARIVRKKLARGQTPEEIFRASAPPGYSEHHTGCAVDVRTEGSQPLEEEFERTDAYRWLEARAAGFSFALSYPRGNSAGFMFEPWHWCFRTQFA